VESSAGGCLSAEELRERRDGEVARGGVRDCAAAAGDGEGFIFLSMEDETGLRNVIVTPDLYERERLTVIRSRFLWVEGVLQNQDGVVACEARRMRALGAGQAESRGRKS